MTQFSAGSLTGYTWGATVAAAALVSLFLMYAIGEKHGLKAGTVPVFGILAIPLCVLAGRAGYYLLNLNHLQVIGVSFLDIRSGGLMLYTALGGGLLAAWLTGKIAKTSFARIADCAAAPAALMIAAGRFAEYLTGAGYGFPVYDWFDIENSYGRSFIAWEEPEILCRFPFAVQDSFYGEWVFAINFLEGLAALVIMVILLRSGSRREGGAAVLMLMLYAACQIIFESMREDEVLKLNFMKVSQLLSALVLLGALILCLRRAKEGGKTSAVRISLLVLFALIATAMEFGLEQKIGFLTWMRADLCYLVMAMCSAAMLMIVYRTWKKAYPINRMA